MIVENYDVFPNNIVRLLQSRFSLEDPDLFITRRPLRSSDPGQSMGIFAAMWSPNEDSFEMRGGLAGWSEPTLQSYIVTVQSFITDMDEERGSAVSATLSKLIRDMLYRDEPLRVGLTALSSTSGNTVETLKRWRIRNQKFVSNELSGNWLYLSTLEIWIETETN